jgi:hypothetical protein
MRNSRLHLQTCRLAFDTFQHVTRAVTSRRNAGNHGSNAVRARAKGASNTPDPLTITNSMEVDHGYPRSYGTCTLADPLGDLLTAHPGRPTI